MHLSGARVRKGPIEYNKLALVNWFLVVQQVGVDGLCFTVVYGLLGTVVEGVLNPGSLFDGLALASFLVVGGQLPDVASVPALVDFLLVRGVVDVLGHGKGTSR